MFVNFAKVFDVIDYGLRLRKLALYGYTRDILHFVSSFLSNRERLVCISTNKSDFLPVKYSVPQGSVLGPPPSLSLSLFKICFQYMYFHALLYSFAFLVVIILMRFVYYI